MRREKITGRESIRILERGGSAEAAEAEIEADEAEIEAEGGNLC